MIHRITAILSHYDLSPAQFADHIAVQRSGISHIMSGRNKPSLDFVQKVLKRFPEISPAWLLTGKGEMILEGAQRTMLKKQETDLFDILDFPESEIKKTERNPLPATEPNDQITKQPGHDQDHKKPEETQIIVCYSDMTCKMYRITR